MGLYVNDLIIAGSTDEAIADVNAYISRTFQMKDLGVINGRSLGLDIKLVKEGMTISMETYIKNMIRACALAGCHRETTPMMLNP